MGHRYSFHCCVMQHKSITPLIFTIPFLPQRIQRKYKRLNIKYNIKNFTECDFTIANLSLTFATISKKKF